MGRFALAAMLAVTLVGCGSFDGTVTGDRNRQVFGVADAEPPAPAPAPSKAVAQTLDWKTRQLCTRGYVAPQETIEPAEDQKQIVDWHTRCNDYEFNLFGVSFANHLTSNRWPF